MPRTDPDRIRRGAFVVSFLYILFHPLVAGLWTFVLIGLSMTKALPTGVAVYGVCLLAMAIALYTEPVPSAAFEPVASEAVEVQPGTA